LDLTPPPRLRARVISYMNVNELELLGLDLRPVQSCFLPGNRKSL